MLFRPALSPFSFPSQALAQDGLPEATGARIQSGRKDEAHHLREQPAAIPIPRLTAIATRFSTMWWLGRHSGRPALSTPPVVHQRPCLMKL